MAPIECANPATCSVAAALDLEKSVGKRICRIWKDDWFMIFVMSSAFYSPRATGHPSRGACDGDCLLGVNSHQRCHTDTCATSLSGLVHLAQYCWARELLVNFSQESPITGRTRRSKSAPSDESDPMRSSVEGHELLIGYFTVEINRKTQGRHWVDLRIWEEQT